MTRRFRWEAAGLFLAFSLLIPKLSQLADLSSGGLGFGRGLHAARRSRSVLNVPFQRSIRAWMLLHAARSARSSPSGESATRPSSGIVTPRRTCGPSGDPVASGMEKISYAGYRFPPEVIDQAIWLYLRFTLSLRDVEDLLAERGVAVSYETVRRWVNHFGPRIAADLRKRRLKPHTTSRDSLRPGDWRGGATGRRVRQHRSHSVQAREGSAPRERSGQLARLCLRGALD